MVSSTNFLFILTSFYKLLFGMCTFCGSYQTDRSHLKYVLSQKTFRSLTILKSHPVASIGGGGGPSVVVSTAAFHARVRGSVPGLGGLKETKKMFLPHPRVKVSIAGSLRDREVAGSASDRQGSNFESCVWRTVSSQSSHHPQEVLLAQFSLYVHKGGLKPDSFLFIFNWRFSNSETFDKKMTLDIYWRCGYN